MTSTYIDPTTFSSGGERTAPSVRIRERVSTTPIVRTFSDATHPFSGVPSKRKTRFQQDYVGIHVGDDLPREIRVNRDPPSHQYKNFDGDNGRFLTTGVRLRGSEPRDRVPRQFELSTQRIQKLNVYPDGTPRTGFVADIGLEQKQNSELGNAIADIATLLKQGIPSQGALTPEEFKEMLAAQFKTGGIPGMIFDGEQRKAALDKSIAMNQAQQDELINRIIEGNLTQQDMIEAIQSLRDSGDMTNEQLKELVDLTAQLAEENDEDLRKEVAVKFREAVRESAVKKAKEAKELELNAVQRNLAPLFQQIDDEKAVYERVIERAGDHIEIGGPLSADKAQTWLDLFTLQSEEGKDSIKFKDVRDIDKSLAELISSNWNGSLEKKQARLAMIGILSLVKDLKGDLPSFAQIKLIKDASQKHRKAFSSTDMTVLNAFRKDVAEIMKGYITPPSSPKKGAPKAPKAPKSSKAKGRKGSV